MDTSGYMGIHVDTCGYMGIHGIYRDTWDTWNIWGYMVYMGISI